MKLRAQVGEQSFECDTGVFHDISIPLKSGVRNPKCFFADDPEFLTIRQGDFIGSVAEGGSVNFKKLSITPHGNGTHTECYGHISKDDDATISSKLSSFFVLAQVHSITPVEDGTDLIVEAAQFPKIEHTVEALVLRTLPNPESKKIKDYSGSNPPYFSSSFMSLVVNAGIRHFLTDLPSVDKEHDGGALSCHRVFWNGSDRRDSTITELIYVPDSVKDGLYLLNLQVPNFMLDAAPSRPLLFPATKV